MDAGVSPAAFPKRAARIAYRQKIGKKFRPFLLDSAGDGFLLTNTAGGVDFDLDSNGAKEKLSREDRRRQRSKGRTLGLGMSFWSGSERNPAALKNRPDVSKWPPGGLTCR